MAMHAYLNLHIGAKRRLDALRYLTLGSPIEARKATWENWRTYCGGLSQGYNTSETWRPNQKVPIWYTHTGQYFASEWYADHVLPSIRHRGWFTEDKMIGEVARGIVAKLPHGRYLAGYEWSCNDERVYFADVYDDKEEAARCADGHARVFAEQSREAFEEDVRQQQQQEENKRAMSRSLKPNELQYDLDSVAWYRRAMARHMERLGVPREETISHPYVNDRDRWETWLTESLLTAFDKLSPECKEVDRYRVAFRCYRQACEYKGHLGGFWPGPHVADAAGTLHNILESLLMGAP